MRGRLALGASMLAVSSSLPAQQLFDAAPGSPIRFHASDSAVLASGDDRTDIDCRVEPQGPRLGFDLRYTAGYVVHVPAEAVSPSGEHLRILFRIRALDSERAEPVYFRQSFTLGPSSAGSGARGTFAGRFVLGPGRYEIDWLMRNIEGRVCSAHWRARIPTPGYTGRLAAAAPGNLIAPYRKDAFDDEPPVVRSAGRDAGLHVSLLVNLAPLERTQFRLSDYETDSIMGMLRSLHREPSIGLFSLVAFHPYDRHVAYSTTRQPRLDFAGIGDAIRNMPAGVVGFDELKREDGDQEFLTEILNTALGPGSGPRDAVVVLGPKVDREARLPTGAIVAGGSLPPIFQLAFNRNPRSYPWPGAIEAALRPLGLTLYTVTRPQDFSRALENLLAAIDGADPLVRSESRN